MAFCNNCGSPLLTEQQVCPNCQNPIDFPATQQLQQTAPPYNTQPGYSDKSAAQFTSNVSYSSENNSSKFFCENIAGLIPLGIYLLAALGIMAGSPYTFGLSWQNLFYSFFTMVPMTVGVALTIRAKGVDISTVYIVTMAGIVYATTGSMVIAVLLAIIIGAINGALIVFLKLPPIAVTFATSLILFGIAGTATNGLSIQNENGLRYSVPVVLLIAFATAAGGICYMMFSNLRYPENIRKSGVNTGVAELLAYPAASTLSAITGVLSVIKVRAAFISMGGNSYLIYLLLIWATINASKLFNKSFMPVIAALSVMFACQLLSTAFAILGLQYFFQTTLHAALVLLIVIGVGIAKLPLAKKTV